MWSILNEDTGGKKTGNQTKQSILTLTLQEGIEVLITNYSGLLSISQHLFAFESTFIRGLNTILSFQFTFSKHRGSSAFSECLLGTHKPTIQHLLNKRDLHTVPGGWLDGSCACVSTGGHEEVSQSRPFQQYCSAVPGRTGKGAVDCGFSYIKAKWKLRNPLLSDPLGAATDHKAQIPQLPFLIMKGSPCLRHRLGTNMLKHRIAMTTLMENWVPLPNKLLF